MKKPESFPATHECWINNRTSLFGLEHWIPKSNPVLSKCSGRVCVSELWIAAILTCFITVEGRELSLYVNFMKSIFPASWLKMNSLHGCYLTLVLLHFAFADIFAFRYLWHESGVQSPSLGRALDGSLVRSLQGPGGPSVNHGCQQRLLQKVDDFNALTS